MRIAILISLMLCSIAQAQEKPARTQVHVAATFLQFKSGPAADKLKDDLTKASSETGLTLHKPKLDVLVNTLKMQRDTKVLMSPSLVAIDGQTASLLAGGEAPYIADLTPAKKNDGTIEYKAVTKYIEFGTKLEVRPNVAADKKSIAFDISAGITKYLGTDEERWSKSPADRDDLKIQKPKVSGIETHVKTTVPDGDALVIELRSKDPAAATQPIQLNIGNAVIDADHRIIVIFKPEIVVPKAPEGAL